MVFHSIVPYSCKCNLISDNCLKEITLNYQLDVVPKLDVVPIYVLYFSLWQFKDF